MKLRTAFALVVLNVAALGSAALAQWNLGPYSTLAACSAAAASQPAGTYTCTGPQAPPSTSTITVAPVVVVQPPPPPASAPPPPVTALASLPYPVPTDFKPQGSPTYSDGTTVTGTDGIVRLQRVADPGGSGQLVYLHRIVRADASPSGTATNTNVRAEKVWIDQGRNLTPGVDYWFALALRPKGGEWPTQAAGLSDDEFLVMQTHSESSGDTQPPLALYVNTGLGKLRWRVSYSAATQAMSQQGNTVLTAEALPAADVWRRYIVHIRPGYVASQNPLTEVWGAVGAGAYVKLASSTAFNEYNWVGGSYPRIGMYKWAGTNWQSANPTIACYLSTLYMGQGANLYDAAVAAVAKLQ